MNVVTPLIQFQNNLRLCHWQTDSFSQHQAFGRIYDSLNDLIDGLVEAYMGVYGRLKTNISFNIELRGLQNIESIISDFILFLSELRNHINNHTDLQNMVDEISGEINTLKYLLTLK